MKRTVPFAILTLLFCVGASSAQNGSGPRRHFDNFDAVTYTELIKEAPPAPAPPKAAPVVKTVSKRAPKASKYKPFVYEFSRRITTDTLKPLDVFTTGNTGIDTLIRDSGVRHGVDPVLIYAIMHQESAFKPKAISYKGARGLMQLMPATASRFGVRNIFDPRENIDGGAKYMRFLLDTFDGDVALALAGYNAGEGAVMKYGRQIPPYRETQEYVRRIAKRYQLLRDPLAARHARQVNDKQLAALKSEEAIPPTLYERDVFAVRRPDGKLQLVRQ